MQLPRRTPRDLLRRQRVGIPGDVRRTVELIVRRVRSEGSKALQAYTLQFHERLPQEPLYLFKRDLVRALSALRADDRDRLARIARQIETFAEAQRGALTAVTVPVPGGTAGHTIAPIERAGCYAPGGRYTLPSSVLMTAVTARVAGVRSVWVATPRPAPLTLAAAAVAGADGLVVAGGAHAVAALAFGVGPIPPSDIVVGPGNSYVTAAKQMLFGEVAVDMLAGPSELVILADTTSDPALVAADLLAQAEHDVQALPILIAIDESLINDVDQALTRQLPDLPTRATATQALQNGGAVLCETWEDATRLCNELAPEHLQISMADPDRLLPQLTNYGAVFIGEHTAEVFGDYGAGPNHVLPTGRSARAFGGLSVFTFLRVRTWLRSTPSAGTEALITDSAWLARQEGLEAHARAAEARSKVPAST